MKTKMKVSQILRTIVLTWVFLSPICMSGQTFSNRPEFDGNNDYVVPANPTTQESTSALSVELLAYSENLMTYDASGPSDIKLDTRTGNAGSDWVYLTSASSVNAARNETTFTGITEFSQFIIARDIEPRMYIEPAYSNFVYVGINYSRSDTLTVYNIGNDTLSISAASNNAPEFTFVISAYQILPGDSCSVVITFSPTVGGEIFDTLFITSNDPDEFISEVLMRGNGVIPEITLFEFPLNFELITTNFISSANYWGFKPTFTDLDGDGLLDLIIGKGPGILNHYEQDTLSSSSFSLVTSNFSSIGVGYYPAPAFTDLDGDGLHDLIIGESSGNLHHYEQDALNSGSFSLVTSNFNSIDEGLWSTPTFTDLNGDGLLDLIIGEGYGNLHHYEQDAVNSGSFSLVTSNFSSIDVGNMSAPTFTDIDDDGLLDLIIGEEEGDLHHYEQDAVNSGSFSLVTSSFNSINLDENSSPTFTDIDGDGFLDLIIGESWDTFSHYEQAGIGIQTMDFGRVPVYDTPQQNYLVKSVDLENDLQIECPTGFKVSLSPTSGFAQNLSVTPVNGIVYSRVYVRFEPVSYVIYSGNIVHTSLGAVVKNIAVSGTGLERTPGTGLEFDGTDDYISGSGIDSISTAISIETWVKHNSLPASVQRYVTIEPETAVLRYDGSAYGGIDELHFYVKQTDGTLSSIRVDNVLTTGEWLHIAGTYDGTTLKLYLNGELIQSSAAATGGLFPLNGDFVFSGSGSTLDGKMDEVRLWNVVRSEQEIRENMYLPITGTETGISYWQFNEGSGTTASDLISGNNGTLHNMTNDDWITSTIPFGAGISNSQIETAGTVDFTDTDLSINFNSQNGAEITVTRIDALANINPTGPDEVFDAQYWVVNRYGTGTFDADLTFTIDEDLTIYDESGPSNIKLYTRSSNADTNWVYLTSASLVNAVNNVATFEGITEFSQFIIARNFEPIIDVDPVTLNFVKTTINYSQTDTLTIYNIGNDTLTISDVSNNLPEFTYLTSCNEILKGDSCSIVVTFAPTVEGAIFDTLFITSNDPEGIITNDPDEFITEVILRGNGVFPKITLLEFPINFELISTNFNAIDVGGSPYPTFTDLEGDGLLDLIFGEYFGILYHYEQDAVNSSSFSLETPNFNSIGVGAWSAPTFTDLDGDILLDLIIGEYNGNLNHYEQDALYSGSFSEVTSNFNSIDVGSYSSPTFTDLDGDGLLDLIIGESDGNLNHYEQDAVSSSSFSEVTSNFNSIGVGGWSAPTFTDLNGDGLLDLIIGEEYGNLLHYEQDAVNSTSFSFVTANFDSIDVGTEANSAFTDLDGDGLLDLIIGGGSSGDLYHYEQEGIQTMDFDEILVGHTSQKSYFLKSADLKNNLQIACPAGFKVSLSPTSGFAQNLSFTPVNGIVSDTIYVLFEPLVLGLYSGNIVHTSVGAVAENIAVSGTGIKPADAFPGNGLEFDGTNDHAIINHAIIGSPSGSFSITLWAKLKSLPTGNVDFLSKHANEGGDARSGYVFEYKPSTGLVAALGTANGWKTVEGTSWSTEEWHHLAITYNSTLELLSLYDNGVLQGTTTVSAPLYNTESLWLGGSSFYYNYCNCELDEITFWNVARTQQQLHDNIHRTLAGNEEGLVSYWQMNEGSGTVIFDYINGYNGNLLNMHNDDWIESGAIWKRWETTGTSNWSTTTNWSTTFSQPTANDMVLIQSGGTQPVITNDAETPAICDDLKIESGATVTVNAGKALTVSDSILNEAGISGLVLKSIDSGTASIIHETTGVNATVERFIPEYAGSAGWHYISSPVAAQPIQPEFVADPPNAGDDFYKFSEPDYLWLSVKDNSGNWNPSFEDNFVVGLGYNVAYANDETKTFAGELNVGDYTFDETTTPAITYTADGGIGWNLLGNPFASSLNWNLCSRTNIDASVYVYDGDAGQYVSWNGSIGALTDGIIPPMNAFFIKASTNPELTIPNSARVHTTNNFYKDKNYVEDLLVLKVEGNGFSDKTYIHFNGDASNEFDSDFDAYKLSGISEAPQLYTKAGDSKLSINVLPYTSEEITIPLSLKVGNDGEYKITVNENTFWKTVDFSLKDLESGNIYDIRTINSLTFSHSPNNSPNRFLLLINGATGIEAYPAEDDGIEIYSYGNQIFIKTDEPGEAQVAVYNLLGQTVLHRTLTVHEASGLSEFTTAKPGFYLVMVKTNEAMKVKKVFIK